MSSEAANSQITSLSAKHGEQLIALMSEQESNPDHRSPGVQPSGRLIINADDWGRDRLTTDMTFDAFRCKTLSSVSAMVFMEDSHRAAEIAREDGIDAGLHLNLTTPFSGPNLPPRLQSSQDVVARFLRRGSLARVIFNPLLSRHFEYLVAAQREEFARLYGQEPRRYDGHHHAHLCSNVLVGHLLPQGKIVRRYFSYEPGQDLRNRAFRRFTDALLASRYHVVDSFFSLPPLRPDRLSRIFSMAQNLAIEVECHPAHSEEHRFLTNGDILRHTEMSPIAPNYSFVPAALN